MSYAQARRKLPFASVAVRVLFVAFLVFSTVNPSNYTLTAWIVTSSSPLTVRLFVAFGLFAVWIATLRIAWQGLRALGFFIVICFGVALALVEYEFDFVSGLSRFTLSLFLLLLVTCLISIGLIGPFYVRWITGQSPVVKNPP